MDVDVAYNGDAKCQFTLHSIGAEINTIYFSGMARIGTYIKGGSIDLSKS